MIDLLEFPTERVDLSKIHAKINEIIEEIELIKVFTGTDIHIEEYKFGRKL
jgi:hypothetical protein